MDVSLLPRERRHVELTKKVLVCFSHLRWSFVYQRPQHLMTRFAQVLPVVFFEEALIEDRPNVAYDFQKADGSGVWVVTPRLPQEMSPEAREDALRTILSGCLARFEGRRPVLWFYTPMMLPLAQGLNADAIVYDCMDELSNFRFAPPGLREREAQLLARADVVFTGGRSLYEAKRARRGNVHCFPSSVDVAHFAKARGAAADPADQAALPRPRLGFYGVVDERLDVDLLDAVAAARPDWSIVVVGPVVKIDPATLPRRPNLSYLGGKAYAELPAYLGGWDVALMPFAMNDATRFISPTKTPEYLAGGKPVVSTPVRDVVADYGALTGVFVAGGADSFVSACEKALALEPGWTAEADARLASMSWDRTAREMRGLIDAALKGQPFKTSSGPAVRPASRKKPYDALIVGAGFAGSVFAERLAADAGKKVLVIDRRPHVAGNAYDYVDTAGLLVHAYGPHIFHTNSAMVVEYLSRFTKWRFYEHRVLSRTRAGLVPMPINRTTLNRVFGVALHDEAQAEAFLKTMAEPVERPRTSEDAVVGAVGRELYEMFFRGYTRKQWALDPSELDKSVAARVPARTNTDDRYFTDWFQAMPRDGYLRLFENMLDHRNIEVRTSVDYDDVKDEIDADLTIYTGPVDAYFGRRYGALPYRSLQFKNETFDREWFQPAGTVNYPDESVPFTRITEYKHITGQAHAKTSVTYEFPTAHGDPYYPIPRPENEALYKRYEALAEKEPGVIFAGRLATYRYYNMDQVVAQALTRYKRLVQADGPSKAASAGGSALIPA